MDRQIRVLHVDDEPSFAETAAEYIQRESDQIEVDTAVTADEALDRLREKDYDCVVSDYEMPDSDGLELFESIRERGVKIPFILFTGRGSEAVASEAISAGVTDYLQKGGVEKYEILANRIEKVSRGYEVRRFEQETEHSPFDIIDRVTDSFYVLDEDWCFAYLNDSAADLFGKERSKLLGESIWELFPEAKQTPFYDHYHEAVEEDETRTIEEYFSPWDRWYREHIYPSDGKLSIISRDVTERKERERELERKERRYEAFFQDPNILVGLLDTDGRLLDANQKSLGYIDSGLEEILNDPFWETPWWGKEETKTLIKEKVREAADGEYVEYQTDHRGDGSQRYVSSGTIRPVRDCSGEVQSLVISSRDITESVQRQEELERVRDFFTESERLAELGAWEFDSKGNHIWTDGTRRIHEVDEGYTPSIEEGISFYHPDDRGVIREAVEDALENGETYDLELRLVTAEDNLRWVRTSGKVVQEEDGERTVRGYIQDITEQKEREEELRRRRDLLRHTERLADTGGWEIETDTGEQRWTAGTYAIHDISPDSEFNPTVDAGVEFYHPDDRGEIENAVEMCIGSGVPYEKELRMITAEERLRWVRTFGEPVHENGEIVKVRGAIQDITRSKEREKELASLEQALETVLTNVPIIFFEIDKDGVIERSEGRALEKLGFEPEEVVGESVYEIFSDNPDIIEPCKKALGGDQVTATAEVNGSVLESWFQPVREGGEVVKVVGHSYDVTKRELRKQQLKRQKERLEEFASIVSHDLRNPLQVASGQLNLAREDQDNDYLETAASALERMNSLIEDVLTLARKGQKVDEFEEVSLEDITEECIRNVGKEELEVSVESDKTFGADRSRLIQMMENLIQNAADHGGEDVNVTVGVTEDGFYVADDGEGIPPGRRDKVFERGYSTANNGTGFGLAIVKEIAEAHDWEVDATESERGGAKFEITGVD
jgi:PAS domain S-box-containing protein